MDGAYSRIHHFARQLASPFPIVADVHKKLTASGELKEVEQELVRVVEDEALRATRVGDRIRHCELLWRERKLEEDEFSRVLPIWKVCSTFGPV